MWIDKHTTDPKLLAHMSKKYHLTNLQSQLLINRGIIKDEDIKMFLSGGKEDISDPFTLKDIDKAINILISCVNNKEKVAILGDYDADGITATTIVARSLRNLGIKVTIYIPSRTKEGYGLNMNAIKKIVKREATTIITVDNGIAANEEVEYAKHRGLKVIVTDHHTIQEDKFPYAADAIINPKQANCKHKNKNLCGAGVAWKLMFALYKKLGENMEFIYKLLALVAIATITDMMSLTGENRILVKEGLKYANEGVIPGLSKLMEMCGITELNSEEIGYRIGPCLNADGRLEDALTAVELLLAEKDTEKLAEKLIATNEERKKLTLVCFNRVMEYIKANHLEEKKFMVVYDENIPEGLVGLVASRVKDFFNVPTLVFTKGENCFKASGRGVEGYPINMFDSLMATKEYWIKGGGHAMACGVSIEPSLDKLEAFANKLNSLAEEAVRKNGFSPVEEYDLELTEPNEDICQEILILEPTGKDNPKARFVTKHLSLTSFKPVGDGSHISFKFNDSLNGIFFGGTSKFEKLNSTDSDKFNILYSPIIDVWSYTRWDGVHKIRSLKLMIDGIEKDGVTENKKQFLVSSLGRFKKK